MNFFKVLEEPVDRLVKMKGRSSVKIAIKVEIKFKHLVITYTSERRKILTLQNLLPTIMIQWNRSLRKRPLNNAWSSMTKIRL
jgi:hypothetical protein